MKFRTLKADEIECRVNTVSEKGCSLLLYKDARADMILLDEAVGCENWQRSHEVVNGNLFCNVGIKIDGEWVWKQDVGTESYTEKEKGQASDSFKRACVNWGIGRELYTSPFIWVSAQDAGVEKKKDGKVTTSARFSVNDIEYDEKRNINRLAISNDKTGDIVFEFGYSRAKSSKPKKNTPAQPKAENKPATSDRIAEADARAKVLAYINRHQMPKEDVDKICRLYGIESIQSLTIQMCNHYISALEKKGKKIDE